MQIGAFAKRFNLNPKTIRYYEAIDLLPAPARTASGYRHYDEAAAARLGFIQRAKLLGLSLDDVRDILAIRERGEQPCARVLALVDAELALLDQRIQELTALRADLTALRRQWAAEPNPAASAACLCPLIEEQTTVNVHPVPERIGNPPGTRT
jgi:DNA-binding transcriptional MerR regulator